ncbi:hypothetical protein GCM10027073_26460 [Streptomyces chlorus]
MSTAGPRPGPVVTDVDNANGSMAVAHRFTDVRDTAGRTPAPRAGHTVQKHEHFGHNCPHAARLSTHVTLARQVLTL